MSPPEFLYEALHPDSAAKPDLGAGFRAVRVSLLADPVVQF
jgi:hypothetical protein